MVYFAKYRPKYLPVFCHWCYLWVTHVTITYLKIYEVKKRYQCEA